MDRRLDVFIIGTQKGGTSSVFEILSAHPQVYGSWAKENLFFTNEEAWAQGASYLAPFFPEDPGQRHLLGAYAHTMYFPVTAERIAAHNPKAQVIACLREPGARAWSAYWFARRNGWETASTFEAALDLEDTRAKGTRQERAELTYLRHGHYAEQLAPFVARLGRDRVHVVLQDDLRARPEETLHGLIDRLGLSALDALPSTRASNTAGVARLPALHHLLLRDGRWKAAVRAVTPQRVRARLHRHVVWPLLKANIKAQRNPVMAPETRARLDAYFAPHNARLSAELGINAPW